MRKTLMALTVAIGSMLAAAPAYAVDPTPPADPSAAATSAIANFGDAAIDVFGSLVTNVWVLALFGFGIALAFGKRVIGSAKGKASKPLGR